MIWSLVQPVQSRPLYNELSLKDTESTPTNTTCSTCNPKQQTDAFDHEFYTPPLSLHARARLVRAFSCRFGVSMDIRASWACTTYRATLILRRLSVRRPPFCMAERCLANRWRFIVISFLLPREGLNNSFF